MLPAPQVVECDLERPETIAAAIGGASKVWAGALVVQPAACAVVQPQLKHVMPPVHGNSSRAATKQGRVG